MNLIGYESVEEIEIVASCLEAKSWMQKMKSIVYGLKSLKKIELRFEMIEGKKGGESAGKKSKASK